MNEEQTEAGFVEASQIIADFMVQIKEAHWLIEYARCQGEYGLGEEWQARYEAWKKEVGL